MDIKHIKRCPTELIERNIRSRYNLFQKCVYSFLLTLGYKL